MDPPTQATGICKALSDILKKKKLVEEIIKFIFTEPNIHVINILGTELYIEFFIQK